MHPTSSLPPIKGFIENSLVDWPGCVCAVLFLPYCNLRCPYCHNHTLVLKPDTLETIDLEAVFHRLAPQRDFIDAICVTGGEPTIHRSLPRLLEAIRQAGFKTKLDTNGTQPEILTHLLAQGLVDHVAMDVKAPLNDTAYGRCAGVYVPVTIIEKSIRALMASAIPVTFRCTVVPSLLTEGEILQMAQDLKALWAASGGSREHPVRLTLQNFNPQDPMDPALKDEAPFEETALRDLQQEVDEIFRPD